LKTACKIKKLLFQYPKAPIALLDQCKYYNWCKSSKGTNIRLGDSKNKEKAKQSICYVMKKTQNFEEERDWGANRVGPCPVHPYPPWAPKLGMASLGNMLDNTAYSKCGEKLRCP